MMLLQKNCGNYLKKWSVSSKLLELSEKNGQPLENCGNYIKKNGRSLKYCVKFSEKNCRSLENRGNLSEKWLVSRKLCELSENNELSSENCGKNGLSLDLIFLKRGYGYSFQF